MITAFDTLKFARRLKQAGLPEAQAEAMAEAQIEAFAEALDTQLATKTDIAELRQATKTDIAELRQATQADIAELREATQANINLLQRGHDHLQGQINLIRWMLTFNLAFTMAIMWKLFLP